MRRSPTSSSNRRFPRPTSRINLTLYLLEGRGMPPPAAGAIAGAYGVALVAGNLAGGAAGDRAGHRPALSGALAGWAACCLAFPLAPAPALGPLALLAGLASGAVRPLMYSVVVTALPADRRREGVALSRAAINAGTVVGPPLGGLLAATDFGAIFVADALTSLALLAVVLRVVPVAEPAGAAAGGGGGGGGPA